MIDRLLRPFDLMARQLSDALTARWWTWPAAMLGFALLTWTCALVVEPRPDEWTYLFGERLGETCAWIQLTGQPCPSCGMTRSFAHAARFHLVQSFFYSPAGLTLFSWITASGVVGAVRLATRDPKRLRTSHKVILAWVLFWVLGLYTFPWVLRILGVNPLP